MADEHLLVQPGSVWASGTILRVVERVGERMVRVEILNTLDDEPGSGTLRDVHIAWLDGGLFLGRCIKEA